MSQHRNQVGVRISFGYEGIGQHLSSVPKCGNVMARQEHDFRFHVASINNSNHASLRHLLKTILLVGATVQKIDRLRSITIILIDLEHSPSFLTRSAA